MSEVVRRRRYQHVDLWDKFWKDKYGDVVIYQRPNVLLIGWVILTLASLFLTGTASNVVWWIAVVVLILWSLLEMCKGVNYLRRLLGMLVLLLVIAAVLKVGY